jgi:selenocysteine-specific elongation factor
MILGTAGHIDHGKTTLVRALTGVDTDRLPEEKRRGITIELGFAPLPIDGIGIIGVVDVPGHEAFVRTMLAGATGIDLALLVVAADEGVMPQTREHLAILGLLGVRAGVVALTKCDLVDEEWRELVTEDVRALVAGTALATAPLIETSATTGAGIERLREAIAREAGALPARDADDLFRMPVDRAFTIKGTGTVVTGTIWSGRLTREASVRVLPADRVVRVRGLQSHGAHVDVAEPGHRTAVALAGVDLADVGRGSILVADNAWRTTQFLRADVALLDDAPQPLRPRTAVRFHLGTSEVGARIVAGGGALVPGERRAARVVLDEPVVVRAGDRFVLRSPSPTATIGGGVVVDPFAARRARVWSDGAHTPTRRLELALAEAGESGIDVDTLAVRLGAPPTTVSRLLAEHGTAFVRVGNRLYASTAADTLEGRLMAMLHEHHRRHPLEASVSLQLVRSRLGASSDLADHLVARAVERGLAETASGMIRAAGWVPRLNAGQRDAMERLFGALAAAGDEPPGAAELAAQFGAESGDLLRMLERDGRVIQVEPDRYYAASRLTSLVMRLRDGMQGGREYAPSELRDLLGFSRKFLIPFLEYCDRQGLTTRGESGRMWRGT